MSAKRKWIICPDCDGDGKHSKHLGAIDMSDPDNDAEFMEDYFAGAYDRVCDGCKGAGKVLEPTPEELAERAEAYAEQRMRNAENGYFGN